jgi:hypothetical protein
MLFIKLFFFFLIQFQEARRAQICFYDKQLRPVSVEYFWIDTDDTKKDYEEKYMTHSIKQHQNFVVRHKGLKLIFRMSNDDIGKLELNIEQPGRINVIMDSDYNYKCVKDCLPYKASFGADITVEI